MNNSPDLTPGPTKLYHGTAYEFERFDCLPMFFAFTAEQALPYAISSYDSPSADGEPTIVSIDVDLSQALVFDWADMIEEWGDPTSSDFDWECLEHHAYDTGAKIVIYKGIEDFTGMTDGVRNTAVYDQCLVMNPHEYTITCSLVNPPQTPAPTPVSKPKRRTP